MNLSHVGIAAALACASTAAWAAEVNGCTIRPAALCVEHDLRTADLRNADLARADFSRSDLSGANLSGANLLSADLDQSKLNRANLSKANLRSADLTHAELYGANLTGATLTKANLHSADLNGALLDRAQMNGADLSGANLPGASLNAANLERANFSGAVLTNADLRGADLAGADFSNATLGGADLTGARLKGARFDGASTDGCRGCVGLAGPAALRNVEDAPRALAPGAFIVAPPRMALDEKLGNGCWARLYVRDNFTGSPVTLVGPIAVDRVSRDLGFPWDPRYESLQVGPAATLTLYDHADFKDRTALFKAGQRVPDLDDVMSVFRSVGSIRVACS